jgi:hypothetical protein
VVENDETDGGKEDDDATPLALINSVTEEIREDGRRDLYG